MAKTKPLPKKATNKKTAQQPIKAKKPAAKPAAKPEPKVLKGTMTERKLKTIQDAKGVIRFLLVYNFYDFIHKGDADSVIAADAGAVVRPSNEWVLENPAFTVYACNPKKNTITVLVTCTVFNNPAEVVEDDRPKDDGTSGQDRESYTDTQDRENYEADTTLEPKPSDEPIKAQAWEDKLGTNAAVKFDASLWFEKATDTDIVTLADDEWAMSDMADQVAKFCAATEPKLKTLFDELPKDGTFSCEVDSEQATEWIKKFRPDVYAAVAGANEENNEYLHDKSGLVPGPKKKK